MAISAIGSPHRSWQPAVHHHRPNRDADPRASRSNEAPASGSLRDDIRNAIVNSPELRAIQELLLRGSDDNVPDSAGDTANSVAPTSADNADLELHIALAQSSSLALSQSDGNNSLSLAVNTSQSLTLDVQIDADGNASLQFSASQSTRISLSASAGAPTSKKQDPLILDLDGDGIETSGLAAGVDFDLNGDGQAERISVASAGDAFLARDSNGNGIIDNGRELFGDQGGAANGFEALKTLDDNHDGVIDAKDRAYSELRTLQFLSTGGQRQQTLQEAGIRSIVLDYTTYSALLGNGDEIAQASRFIRDDGREGLAADVLVHVNAVA